MSSSEDRNATIDTATQLGGPQSALEALTRRNISTSYHWFRSPERPPLKSDLKTKGTNSNRGTDESTATWASNLSSIWSGTRSDVESAATSSTSSVNLGQTFKSRKNNAPPVSESSRFSTLTLGNVDGHPDDGPDPFTRKGALFTLVQRSTECAVLRGAVDVYNKKCLREPLMEKLFDMIKKPEVYAERYRQQQRENAARTLLRADPLDSIVRSILRTPASSRRPSESPSIEHAASFAFPPHRNESIPISINRSRQPSTSSTAMSHHIALSGATRPSSASSVATSQHLPRPHHTMAPSIKSVVAAADAETDDYLSDLVESGTLAPWRQRKSWNSVKSAETHNSAEDEDVHANKEKFQIDIRIYHPGRTVNKETLVIALCDSQSDHSFISPKALDRLGIPITDVEWIKPTTYTYRINDGPPIAPRGKIDLTWRAFSSSGAGKYHTNRFYIAGDDAPYDGVLLGHDHILPKNGPARMSYHCLVGVQERKTAEQKAKAKKAKKDHLQETKENEKLKKEAAAAAAQAQQTTP